MNPSWGFRANDRTAGEEIELRSRVVVAADGRYSTVRERLGIDPNRGESDFEVVWVKLPDATATNPAAVHVNEHGALANVGCRAARCSLGF